MPRYDYHCKYCGLVREIYKEFTDDSIEHCPDDQQPMHKKIPRFTVIGSMPAHFNSTIGRHVRNESDFRDGLKKLSDERTESTGIPHNYQPVDLRDKEAVGATDEGLDSTYNARKAKGLPVK